MTIGGCRAATTSTACRRRCRGRAHPQAAWVLRPSSVTRRVSSESTVGTRSRSALAQASGGISGASRGGDRGAPPLEVRICRAWSGSSPPGPDWSRTKPSRIGPRDERGLTSNASPRRSEGRRTLEGALFARLGGRGTRSVDEEAPAGTPGGPDPLGQSGLVGLGLEAVRSGGAWPPLCRGIPDFRVKKDVPRRAEGGRPPRGGRGARRARGGGQRNPGGVTGGDGGGGPSQVRV